MFTLFAVSICLGEKGKSETEAEVLLSLVQ